MIAYCYHFHYLHPKEYADCQRYDHEILLYVDGRVCNQQRKFSPTDLGNLTLDIPQAIADRLTNGFMIFDVSSTLSDPPESFLAVTGNCCDRPQK